MARNMAAIESVLTDGFAFDEARGVHVNQLTCGEYTEIAPSLITPPCRPFEVGFDIRKALQQINDALTSQETPKPLGIAGWAGTSFKSAHVDHIHAAERGPIIYAAASDQIPLPCAAVGSPGMGDWFSRWNHVHPLAGAISAPTLELTLSKIDFQTLLVAGTPGVAGTHTLT